jgi:CubicO group peptidase (beta-lactamase class C family)
MKKTLITLIVLTGIIAIIYLCLPTYFQKALRYNTADIDEWNSFTNLKVEKADSSWDWKYAKDYNKYEIPETERKYIEKQKTVSFLVIQNDSVKYEEYWDGWTQNTTSNIFSCTKSIVSLLVGIAIDEGKIKSVDQSIGEFLPEFAQAPENKITIKNLLTMSSGSTWSESHSSIFSITAKGYYGDNLKELILGLKAKEEPGKVFEYRSGDTQILSFIVEKATGMTISKYAQIKLWKPLQTNNPALWSLDKEGGDEKAFCCFNTNARDIARIAKLILNKGKWNGTQIISEKYITEATTPASYLLNEDKNGQLDYYGYQFWIIEKNGHRVPYLRGLNGQFIYAIPEKNAIAVRLGYMQDIDDGPITIDIPKYLDIAYKILK